ncbi:hypothetical protein GDO78_014073 [Eleutherodactylus coqui]|uniref:Uncharacterized protein n=1 Tax=Eleutherodactylus coqui TaxID=57060 RepID=A0A8J6EF29_ELECQ|nr:hypothetical protein GDO78_014073 [Eleutherodactylus coqui]
MSLRHSTLPFDWPRGAGIGGSYGGGDGVAQKLLCSLIIRGRQEPHHPGAQVRYLCVGRKICLPRCKIFCGFGQVIWFLDSDMVDGG